MKAAFVLPEKIPLNLFNYEQLTPEEQELRNASCFGAAELVRVMTKSAIDMGYKPVGDIQYDIRDGKYVTKPYMAYVYQPLENDALGCPKVSKNTDRIDMCRVEFGNYNSRFVRHTYTNIYEKAVVPTILGGDGKTKRWIIHMEYNNEYRFGLIVDDAKNLNISEGEHNYYYFALGLQKHLKPGQFVYVPAYVSWDETWTPQCVIDNKGTHYFSVVVPQNRPAMPELTVQEPTSTLGSTMTDWLKKATTF